MAKRGPEDLLLSPQPDLDSNKKQNNLLSPKATMIDLARDEAVQRIQMTAPEWFGEAFSFLICELNRLREDIGVKQKLATKVNILQEEVIELQTENTQLKEQIVKLETYQRRDNLIIDGLTESPHEDINVKVLTFFSDTLKICDGRSIQITRVHRLGRPITNPNPGQRPRQVIVRFHYYPDRERVFKASWQLRDNVHYVNEDFPPVVRERRKKLLPCLKAAKKNPKIAKASLRGDRLIINGMPYTVDSIENLPFDLANAAKGEYYDTGSDSTYFFGIDSYLSNFHPCTIKYNSLTFKSSEQFYQYHKCLEFGDDARAEMIYQAKTPGKAKSLVYGLNKFKEEVWMPKTRQVMETACELKFTQNETLGELLKNTKGTIVECNPSDTYFSCGLSKFNPNRTEESKWTGANVLGNVLMTLRDKISY